MKIVFSDKCLEYKQEGHPETPERIKTVHDFLKGVYEFVEPTPAEEKDILLVHTKELLEKVRSGNINDADTPNHDNIFSYASLSAGGAIKAAELAVKEENAFSLMRPPGHHAGRDFLGGFCYFNNLAIAVEKALKDVGRVCIIDFDGHHGNGTQDIFLGDKDVLYVSLHQSPLFPGTGLKPEKNCLNYPLPPGVDHRVYIEVLTKALHEVRRFDADLLAVSAGFDSCCSDPLTSILLQPKDFEKIGKLIEGLDKPLFAVLEGGYSEDMHECVYSFLKGLV